MLTGASDPFCGLPLLKLRYAAGRRPPREFTGSALTWLLSGEDVYAQKALAELRSTPLRPAARPSRDWYEFARISLAFDWLYGHPAFAPELKDKIAQHLADGAESVLATPDLKRPEQASYHNYTVRYLCLALFALTAVDGHGSVEERCRPLREQAWKAFDNILDLTALVSPDGSYHESMDYMRITWASLCLMAELQRTAYDIDPARRYSVFRNMGETYLYKLLPDGTPSREGDNEYPILDPRDAQVLGYAIHRFKDPYSAWLLRNSGFVGAPFVLPVAEFLWNDDNVMPRDPALASEHELPRSRYFGGVGQLVVRSDFGPNATRIEFDCGPYFSKHQHLDRNQFTIYHRGHLAIDSGADYTDSESPHYLNYYRRTVAHNSVLVYDPNERFFWSANVLRAANDGGQRMDSSRFWNTVRSLEDWERTRDLWDLGTMRTVDSVPGQYCYALGDATRAYSPAKLRRFTRELLYSPVHNVLFVFDHVISTKANFHKAWLLHGVNEPEVTSRGFRFREGQGELLAHVLLPEKRRIQAVAGLPAPGDDRGGPWGSGEDWPLEPADGGPLPTDPHLRQMWKVFWGDQFDRILKSNRKNVVPGGWRVEVSPAVPAEEDRFLHVIEIGDRGATGNRQVELLDGLHLTGAVLERGPAVLFSTDTAFGEVTLPSLSCDSLVISGLSTEAVYELSFSGSNLGDLPGVPLNVIRSRTNEKGILRISLQTLTNSRLRLTKV